MSTDGLKPKLHYINDYLMNAQRNARGGDGVWAGEDGRKPILLRPEFDPGQSGVETRVIRSRRNSFRKEEPGIVWNCDSRIAALTLYEYLKGTFGVQAEIRQQPRRHKDDIRVTVRISEVQASDIVSRIMGGKDVSTAPRGRVM